MIETVKAGVIFLQHVLARLDHPYATHDSPTSAI